MQNHCISTKNVEDTHTVYSASKLVEIFMGADTDYAIDTLFDTHLQRFQQAIQTSNNNGSRFTYEKCCLIVLLFYENKH